MKMVYSKKEYTSAIKDFGAVFALDAALTGIIRECIVLGGSIEDAIKAVVKLRDNILDNLYSSIGLDKDKDKKISINTMIKDTTISDNREATEIK